MDFLNELLASIQAYKKYPGDRLFELAHPILVQTLRNSTSSCPIDTTIRARVLFLQLGFQPLCDCGKPTIGATNWKTCGVRRCKTKSTCLARYGVENPQQSMEIRSKVRKTCLERYGVENPQQSAEIRSQTVLTCQQRYGGSNPMVSEDVRQKQQATTFQNYGVSNPTQSEEIRKRVQQTNFERYGGHPQQNAKIRDKSRKTWLEHYGVEHPWQHPKIRARCRQTVLKRCGVDHPSKLLANKLRKRRGVGELFGSYPPDILCKLQDKAFWQAEYYDKEKTIFQIAAELGISSSNASKYFGALGFKARDFHVTSQGEKELAEFISAYAGIETAYSLGRQSLDIYVPELKLAFEYNGIYWHSEKYRDWDYHLKKTLECERLGIRLIHIWEDDWILNQELMKRKIKALLGREDQKVFARKCKVVVPSIEQKRAFYIQNHIKGDGAGSVSYALQYQDQLVAMITFKDMKEGLWDLNRYATNCSIPGGFSKLLEHFKRNHSWSKIYTYADRSWSRGEVYLKCGFVLEGETPPAFYGFDGFKRINRLQYTHENLRKRFPDLQGTQFQIMDQVGILRIWDCGQLKFGME